MLPLEPSKCADQYKDAVPQTVHDTLVTAAERISRLENAMLLALEYLEEDQHSEAHNLLENAVQT